MEVELTKERTRMGLQAKNEGRWVGKPPYGYDSVYAESENEEDKGLLRINPAQSRSFQWYLSYTTKENR